MTDENTDERALAYFEKWLTPGEQILWLGRRNAIFETRLMDCVFACAAACAIYVVLRVTAVESLLYAGLPANRLIADAAVCFGVVVFIQRIRKETAYVLTNRRVMRVQFGARSSGHRQLALRDIRPRLSHRTGGVSDLCFANGTFPDNWAFEGIEKSETVIAQIKAAQQAIPAAPAAPPHARPAELLTARLLPGESVLRQAQPRADYWAGARELLASLPHVGGVATLLSYGFTHHLGIADAVGAAWFAGYAGAIVVRLTSNARASKRDAYAVTNSRFIGLKAGGDIPVFVEADLLQIRNVSRHTESHNSGTLQIGVGSDIDITVSNLADIREMEDVIRRNSRMSLKAVRGTQAPKPIESPKPRERNDVAIT